MTTLQLVLLTEMAVFYAAYFAKQLLQYRKGTITMILGEGNKPAEEKRQERILKIATFTLPFVEIVSICFNWCPVSLCMACIGAVVGALGVLTFILGMTTMRDSWRAGIPEQKETSLVTTGIYRFSRNPAFLGFDLLYIGILISFPNMLHAFFVLFNIVLFHRQILAEERFLESAFGQEYRDYKQKTRRYL